MLLTCSDVVVLIAGFKTVSGHWRSLVFLLVILIKSAYKTAVSKTPCPSYLLASRLGVNSTIPKLVVKLPSVKQQSHQAVPSLPDQCSLKWQVWSLWDLPALPKHRIPNRCMHSNSIKQALPSSAWEQLDKSQYLIPGYKSESLWHKMLPIV